MLTNNTHSKLSVIVPVYCEGSALINAIEQLTQALSTIESWELIVVDGSPVHQRSPVFETQHVTRLLSEPGRAIQMNAGAHSSSGDCLLFLHVDTTLPQDVAAWWQNWGEIQPEWGFFPVTLSGEHKAFRMIEKAISYRSRWSSISTGDQAQFVRRDVFEALGGFEAIPLMEDVALSVALRKRSTPWVWRSPVLTSSRRWEENGIWRTIMLMWGLRAGYALGVSPQRLKSYYR